MTCAFLLLFMICGSIGILAWLACRKIAAHLRKNPEAAKLLVEHVIVPIFKGDEAKEAIEAEDADNRPVPKPEPKKRKASLL